MTKEKLVEIKAREVIPTAFLRKCVSSEIFEKIVLPLFIKAYREKDRYLSYGHSRLANETAQLHKTMYRAYVEALLMFYDEPKPIDEYSNDRAVEEAFLDLHMYEYHLEAKNND